MRVIVLLLIGVVGASNANAQTWSSERGRPALWQITSVDATGEPNWPYGDEDIAGDGAGTFEADEAGADLRTVYADADANRLWLRAYVAAESAPSENVVAYFFLDTDARNSTGGAATSDLWPELEADPRFTGYERVVAASGDGALVGAWSWSAASNEWMVLATQPGEIVVEVELDVDPIRIGANERGYIQVDIDHEVSTLDSSCDGNLFVRIWHDDTPARTFGDDDDEASACRLALDRFDDPIVLREPACSEDSDCPAGGECADGVCLFTYECSGNADCPTSETCSAGECVRVVDEDCTTDAMCDGLVCVGGNCTACAQSAARACGENLVCSPDGSCVDTDDPVGVPVGGISGEIPPGNVQGGAFTCAALRPSTRAATLAVWSLLFVLAVLGVRART